MKKYLDYEGLKTLFAKIQGNISTAIADLKANVSEEFDTLEKLGNRINIEKNSRINADNKEITARKQAIADLLDNVADKYNTLKKLYDYILTTKSNLDSGINSLDAKLTEKTTELNKAKSDITTLNSTLSSHTSDKTNPHCITASQLSITYNNAVSNVNLAITDLASELSKIKKVLEADDTSLDTLQEIINTLKDDASGLEALYTTVGTKANKSDVYTKTEIDTELNLKANSSNVYSRNNIDDKLKQVPKSWVFGSTGEGVFSNNYKVVDSSFLGAVEGSPYNSGKAHLIRTHEGNNYESIGTSKNQNILEIHSSVSGDEGLSWRKKHDDTWSDFKEIYDSENLTADVVETLIADKLSYYPISKETKTGDCVYEDIGTSYIGSISNYYETPVWAHVMRSLHRNGSSSDANDFILEISSKLADSSNLRYRKKVNGTWTGHRLIYDNSNLTTAVIDNLIVGGALDNRVSNIENILATDDTSLDTLQEIINTLKDDASGLEALYTTVETKANSSDVYTKTEVNTILGNISTLLDDINGEVV